MSAPSSESGIEQARRAVGRAGFVFAFSGLSFATMLHLLGYRAAAAHLFPPVVALLLVLPIVNVLGVLAEEARRRDWVFVGLALAVLGLVIYAVIDRLG